MGLQGSTLTQRNNSGTYNTSLALFVFRRLELQLVMVHELMKSELKVANADWANMINSVLEQKSTSNCKKPVCKLLLHIERLVHSR
jgi:hypothetical protein